MATENTNVVSRQDFGQEVAPYAQTLLGNAQYLTDNSPYEKYKGERIAQFDPLQTQAFDAARDLGENQYTRDAATGIAGLAERAGNLYYNSSQYQNPYQNPYNLGYNAQGAYAANAGNANTADSLGYNASTYDGTSAGPAERFYGENASAAQLGAAPTGQYQQFGGPRDVNAERVNAPDLRDLRMDAAKDITSRDVQSQDINAAQTGYNPNLQNYQMGPAERVETKSFAQPGSADAYMSPYMQSVVGIQQREADRQAGIALLGRKGEQTRAGAFGGSRAAIMDAEAARNLATQKGDIQAQGSQAAYQQAQQQFNAEQAQNLQAQTSNQQAGLTTGQQNLAANLGVQQLGAGQIGLQTSLANLNNQQQASVQNEANRLQAQGLTSSQAMQAALANQGVQQQANVQNLSAGLQTQGLGAQTGLQAQQANQQTGLSAQQYNQGMDYNTAMQNAQMRQQMGLANQAQQGQYGLQQGQFNQAANAQTSAQRQAAGMSNQQAANQMAQYNAGNRQQAGMQNAALGSQASQFGAGAANQAALANAQARNQMAQYNSGNQQQAELANQAARNRAAEFNVGQELASAQNRAQYGQATNQLNEQSRQYGAGYGLQGMQAGMTGYGNLANVGNTLYGQDTGAINMQNQFGTQRQNVATGILQNQYGDFQAEQNHPYKNISFMSDIVRGLPATASANTMSSSPAPSTLSQIGGFGAAALGTFGASGGFGTKNNANGGMVGRYAKGGLVKSRPQGLVALAIHSMA